MFNRTSKKILINSSGKDGMAGVPGREEQHGTNGNNGEHAKAINVFLSADEHNATVELSSNYNKQSLPLEEANAEIILMAQGGQGGKGGDGGDGHRGTDGADGSDASTRSPGTDGGHAGSGGDGGPGGDGGVGGDGGDITVTVSEHDMDLLMLVDHQSQGGRGGVGGKGGQGGRGGYGGRGGSSYSWTEWDTDSEGNLQSTSYSMPGGSSGADGHSGNDGKAGQKGERGKHGNYQIRVLGLGHYVERYDLQVTYFNHIASEDGIIEPEECLAINQLTIKNTGHMPTPAPIAIYLTQNTWIGFNAENILRTPDKIRPGDTLTMSQSLEFNVKSANAFIPAIDSTFHSVGHIYFGARLPRVQKDFPRVAKQYTEFAIRYPVEISIVSNANAITRNEEAPFAIQCRNISKKALGTHTLGGRSLILSIEVAHGVAKNALLIKNKMGDFSCSLSEPVRKNASLMQQEIGYFSGTLKFTNSHTPAYTNAQLTVTLHLANHRDKNQLDIIQKRNFHIQLADEYQYDPKADFVLVTNHQIKKETVDHWQKMVTSLGSHLSVWNTSLYSGLSYAKKRHDGGSFKSELSGKVVIILDNYFVDDIHNQTKSTHFLDQKELFDAAKTAHISTYVIGPSFDINNAVTPRNLDDNDQKTTITIQDYFAKWNKPKFSDLERMAMKFQEKSIKNSPTERKTMVLNFNPVKLNEGIFDQWKLGTIQICPMLDIHQAHIAYRPTDPHSLDKYDVFNIVKLLPFEKKIKYFYNCLDVPDNLDLEIDNIESDDNITLELDNVEPNNLELENIEIIKKAILSDLMDELLAFSKNKWAINFSKETISSSLILINTLAKCDFSFIKLSKLRSEFVSDLFLKYKYAVMRIPDVADQHILPFFKYRHILSGICLQKINVLLKKYFSKIPLEDKIDKLSEQWKNIPQEEFFYRFSDAYLAGTVYDNQINIDEKIILKSGSPVKPKKSMFSEGIHFFKTKEERESSISSHEKQCTFDLAKPHI